VKAILLGGIKHKTKGLNPKHNNKKWQQEEEEELTLTFLVSTSNEDRTGGGSGDYARVFSLSSSPLYLTCRTIITVLPPAYLKRILKFPLFIN